MGQENTEDPGAMTDVELADGQQGNGASAQVAPSEASPGNNNHSPLASQQSSMEDELQQPEVSRAVK